MCARQERKLVQTVIYGTSCRNYYAQGLAQQSMDYAMAAYFLTE